MTDLPTPTILRERLARAICAESCAFRGEPPCWKAEGEPWPNPNCNEPGCHALADAARAAIRKAMEPAPCPPSPKIIEAVARAISKDEWGDFDVYPAEWMDIASVAIAAFLAAMKEDGYVMVPVEPTEAMRKTALWHGDDYDAERYATMRAARIDREG